jgi:UDP-N-acetylmuramate--alanine ligase
VTSIEYDHPDFFKTPGEMVQSFTYFIDLLPQDGLLIACSDDPTTAILAQNRFVAGLPVTTYGIQNSQAQWRASNIHIDDRYQTVFDVLHDGRMLGIVELQVPGDFNVLNALAALIVADKQGVPFGAAAAALKTFQGAGRRFHARGEMNGVLVVDDYAHHPTAIKLTLQAARERFPERHLWAVWQPHTYSRTQHLWEAYTLAFEAADHVLVTEIYAAREDPIEGIDSAELVKAIRHPDARYVPTLDAAVAELARGIRPPALILIMSAGDAPLIGVNYLKLRQQQS